MKWGKVSSSIGLVSAITNRGPFSSASVRAADIAVPSRGRRFTGADLVSLASWGRSPTALRTDPKGAEAFMTVVTVRVRAGGRADAANLPQARFLRVSQGYTRAIQCHETQSAYRMGWKPTYETLSRDGLELNKTALLVHTTISCLRYGQNRSNKASSSGHLRALVGEGFLYWSPDRNFLRTSEAPFFVHGCLISPAE